MIADLHCDLLDYLGRNAIHTPFDTVTLCSIPQLKEGGVFFQGLPIYTATNETSIKRGLKQASIFSQLDLKYSKEFSRVRNFENISQAKSQGKIGIMAAVENASAFALETEPLKKVFGRLEEIIEIAGPLFYISLTHFSQNRFCGGNATPEVGLKKDGKELIRYLSGRKISIDMSHTSDPSAHDILDFVDKSGIDIPIIASHSNFRTVEAHARNLPDDIAKEIIFRKGLIGLNFVRDFIGPKNAEFFLRQIKYALEIGGKENLCFGADFFYIAAAVEELGMPADYPFFHKNFDSSACYPRLIEWIKKDLRLDQETIQKIADQNCLRYLQEIF